MRLIDKNNLAKEAGQDLIDKNPRTFFIAYEDAKGNIFLSSDGWDKAQQIGILEFIKFKLLVGEVND